MASIFIIVIGTAILGAIGILIKASRGEKTKPPLPPASPAPALPVVNDKVVHIRTGDRAELLLVLHDFCTMYRESHPDLRIYLADLGPGEYLVTFPGNIPPATFAYFINYLYYPIKRSLQVEAIGWTTVGANEGILQDQIETRVMFYMVQEDKEKSSIWMATEDHDCWRWSFQDRLFREEKWKRNYAAPVMEATDLHKLPPGINIF